MSHLHTTDQFSIFAGVRPRSVSIDHIRKFYLQNECNISMFGSREGVVCAFESIDFSAEKSGRGKVK